MSMHKRRDEIESLLARSALPADKDFSIIVSRRLRPATHWRQTLAWVLWLIAMAPVLWLALIFPISSLPLELGIWLTEFAGMLAAGLSGTAWFDFSLTGLILLFIAALAPMTLLLRD